MGGEWQNVTLGDLFNVKHGFAFKGEYFVDDPTETLLVTPGNFAIGGGFQNTKPKFYNGPIPEEYVLRPGQVVVTMTDLSKQSDTLGLAAVIPKDQNVWLHNQRVGLLEFEGRMASDPRFLSYLLRTHEYRSWVVGSATGTTVKHTSPSRIQNYSCSIPPLSEQKSIAHILGTLDDKIELNRQMNATLEAMAQALFKSWFVDFDPVIDNALAAGNPIPDELQARAENRAALGDKRKPLPEAMQQQFPSSFVFSEEMGWIPEGWEVGTLEDMIVLQRGFDLPKSQREDGCYPLMVASGQDGTHSEYKVKGPGITTGRSGKLGDVNLVLQDFWPLNTTLWIKEYKRSSPYHALYLLRSLALEKYNAGSAVPTLNRNHVHNIPLPAPPKRVVELHESQAKDLYRKILFNVRQVEQLSKLRDTLLPKLLSGQLRIPEAETLVADAV
ncbi:MAG: restriction endonuclease subunit S [Desulfuromonas sp.]|nr:MAG: restriction endonuclease subunit S [Desulfuromonas sp.]